MKPIRYYAVTDDGGHAYGTKREIDALCTLGDWRHATKEEYKMARRLFRKLESEQFVKNSEATE